MPKIRLDVLVQRQAGVSRSKAQGLIETGHVSDAAGNRLNRPGMAVEESLAIEVREGPRYVSRGGEKLAAAFEAWDLDVREKVAIDVGASTGGFTDVLLQRGARKVYAVDVGYGQLDWRLRQDARVVAIERTNIRNLTPEMLLEPPEFFTVDCSFIGLRTVLGASHGLLAEGADGVALIKPQFEAGRQRVGRGGVVKDPAVHEEVIENVRLFSLEVGFEPGAVLPSPLLGPKGNREFLIRLRHTRIR